MPFREDFRPPSEGDVPWWVPLIVWLTLAAVVGGAFLLGDG